MGGDVAGFGNREPRVHRAGRTAGMSEDAAIAAHPDRAAHFRQNMHIRVHAEPDIGRIDHGKVLIARIKIRCQPGAGSGDGQIEQRCVPVDVEFQ